MLKGGDPGVSTGASAGVSHYWDETGNNEDGSRPLIGREDWVT